MNRHLALTVAGLSAVLVTAVSGTVAANVGLLNVGAEKPVGQLTAANVGQLVAPDSAQAVRSSGDGSGESVEPAALSGDGATGGTSVGASGSSVVGSSANRSSGGSAVGSGTSVNSQSTAPSAPSLSAPVPPPGVPTTSRSSQETDDDYDDDFEDGTDIGENYEDEEDHEEDHKEDHAEDDDD